jgi:hypothetical protein
MRRTCDMFDCYEPAVDFVEFHSSACPKLNGQETCNCGPIQRIWLCVTHYDNQDTIIGQRVKPTALA